MARLPQALIAAFAACLLSTGARAQSPDDIVGTLDGAYRLFTPGDVVQAGAGDAAPTYRFFHHADVAAQTVTSGNLPITLNILPDTTFSDGLQFGPFHTQLEGSLVSVYSTGAAALTLELATVHKFADGKVLTTRRTDTDRVSSTGGVFALAQFSSVTNLQPGSITFDDGSTGTIDTALLESPVSIAMTLKISAQATETITSVGFSPGAGVTMYQLRDPILNAGGGGSGGGPALSNATPKADAGSGAAGSASTASRGDHVHPAASTPPPSGGGDVATLDRKAEDIVLIDGITYRGTVTPCHTTSGGYPARNCGSTSARDNNWQSSFVTDGECVLTRANTAPVVSVEAGTVIAACIPDRAPTSSVVPLGRDRTEGLLVSHAVRLYSDSDETFLHLHQWGTPTQVTNEPIAYKWFRYEFAALPANTPFTNATLVIAQLDGNPISHTTRYFGDVSGAAGLPSGGAALSDTAPKPTGTAAAGTGKAASRDDHVHALAAGAVPPYSTATPAAVGTGAAGSANTVSRGDHAHAGVAALPAYSLTAQDVGAASAPGTADALTRGDHVHAGATIAQVAALSNTVNRPSGAALQDGQVNTLDNCQGAGTSRHCTTEWRTPSGGGSGGLPAFDGAGKHLATNADDNAAVWVTPPPDLTLAVSGNDDDIEALDFLTQDLVAGTPTTGWATVANVNNVGIALFDGAPSCNAARGATYQPSFAAGIGGKSAAVRVKAGFATANARVEVKGEGETYEDLISGWALLCTSSDGTFAYYREFCAGAVCIFGTGVASLAMQTTGGAHIGTSKYLGDPTTVERWAIVGNSATVPIGKTLPALTGKGGNVLRANTGATDVEWDSAHDTVLAGLPALTGHGGNCLRANSAATGLEFSACGGSSGGDGGISYTELARVSFSTTVQSITKTGMGNTCRNADFLAVYTDNNRLMPVILPPVGINGSTAFDFHMPADWTTLGPAPDTWLEGAIVCVADGNLVFSAQSEAANVATNVILAAVTSSGGGGGGGGGDTNPTIPAPTAAGALKHLRVNAAGAAYELAALPAIPQGSSDTPKAASSGGNAGSSNRWSPSDHSHPLEANDTVVWGQVLVSTLTGGGASGGVDCDGAAAAPTAASCKAITDALRRGEYRFLFLRVIREDSDTDADPAHASGCALYPGVPGTILSDSVVYEAACTANSGKNSANTFNQYDVFVSFGNTGNYIQVRLPNYNSYGVSRVAVSLTGVR